MLAGVLANRLKLDWKGPVGQDKKADWQGCITQLESKGKVRKRWAALAGQLLAVIEIFHSIAKTRHTSNDTRQRYRQ